MTGFMCVHKDHLEEPCPSIAQEMLTWKLCVHGRSCPGFLPPHTGFLGDCDNKACLLSLLIFTPKPFWSAFCGNEYCPGIIEYYTDDLDPNVHRNIKASFLSDPISANAKKCPLCFQRK